VGSKRAHQLPGLDRSTSLREILDSQASGADFYEQAERMMHRPQAPVPRSNFIQEDYELDLEDDDGGQEETPSMREQVLAQRISQLPPQLQALAEDSFQLIDEGEDEMWSDNEFAPDIGMGSSDLSQPSAPPLNIERAARVANVDFSRAQKLLGLTEQKRPTQVDPDDFRRQREWKMQQLERKRRELESKKVG